jgi:alpha-mannosidase
MANRQLAVNWDLDGNLVSVIDIVRGRELVSPGSVAAMLELAADRPVRYDAWDVESWTVAAGEPITTAESVTIDERGPLLGAVSVHRVFGPSTATVRYVLRAGSPRLDVVISLDWYHDEHLLSMTFPLDVHTDTASCGVQFGAVRRPTHASTSWDAAKFEVCAHRYVDVAEPDFGVAVLNDGRYGHGLFGGPGSRVRVSLARAAKYPDPGADHGHHEVTLSLLPHGPGLADVVAEAERLDLPLRVVDREAGRRSGDDALAADRSPDGTLRRVVSITARGAEVDAVKLADDGSGDVIVRLHEATGNRVSTSVAAPRRIIGASACDLLESAQRSFEVSDGIVALTLRPFDLVTLRLRLDAHP